MNHKYSWASFFVACLLFIIMPFHSQAYGQQNDELIVGVAGDEPFVVNVDQQTGISLEIWQIVANKKDLNYQLVSFKSIPNALNAMQEGEVDIVAGPISITPERAKGMKFTQPYYQSSISIMSSKVSPSFWQRIGQLLSFKFLYGVAVFLFILAIVGFLFWLAEHEVNSEEFSTDPAPGIGDGMWCAIVTMTTTGYGDIAPRTLWGRIIAGTWMIFCIASATTLIAGVASALSVNTTTTTITKVQELANDKVAVVKGSPAALFVDRYNVDEVYIDNLEEGHHYLKSDKVAAVVFDTPQMIYYLKKHPDEKVTISNRRYMRQGYGFAFPLDSRRIHQIDITLLKLQEAGRVERIVTNWLGKHI